MIYGYKKNNRFDMIIIYFMIYRGYQILMLYKLLREL